MMNFRSALTGFSVSFIVLVFVITAYKTKFDPLDIMVDRHGRWRIPTQGTFTQYANKFIKSFPRWDSQFNNISTVFDMDNSQYISSTVVYILFFGGIGCLFLVFVGLFLIGRYCCDCCGGKNVPRKGYKESSINFYRYGIIIFSFFLEGLLVFGYFANTDLHNSLDALTTSFTNTSDLLTKQFNSLRSSIPENIAGLTLNMTILMEDLEFSARYASGQSDIMKRFLDGFETTRMVIILANLIGATLGCSLGIAAGSVRKGTPVIIMVSLFAISGALFFFSFGTHFAGSKMISEFCTDIDPYIITGNDDFLPMRLQFFVPCVSSPVYPFIKDHLAYEALIAVDDMKSEATSASCSAITTNPPTWYNVTDSYYKTAVTSCSNSDLTLAYTIALNKSTPMIVLDQSITCRWSKNELRLDSFLLCTYAKDNLDMIMMTQGIGAVLLVLLTILGIPAIKRFKYAGNANLEGVLDANKRFMGKRAKAKRTVI